MKCKDKRVIIYTHRAWPITNKIHAANPAHSVTPSVLMAVLAFNLLLWVGSCAVGISRHKHFLNRSGHIKSSLLQSF